MPEKWVEENIQPIGTLDQLLHLEIRNLVNYVKSQGWIMGWHFLRESENWQGRGQAQPLIVHIRLRFKVKRGNLRRVRNYCTTELDRLRANNLIIDHYRGSHGNPNTEYQGESANFDENAPNPQGWRIAQHWLTTGSEIELLLLSGSIQGVTLGSRFIFPDLLHFYANQCDKVHYRNLVNRGGVNRQAIIIES
jgi:hypothetical protein